MPLLPRPICLLLLTLPCVVLGGCLAGPRELSYLDEADLSHYRDVATQIVDPITEEPGRERPKMAREPRRLSSREEDKIWDMSLQTALNLALRNNAIIRESATFLSPNNRLLANPELAASVFNPAIQETNVAFGRRGVEASLSDFDPVLNTSMNWSTSRSVQRTANLGFNSGDTLEEDSGRFRSGLSKITRQGTQLSINHNWDYLQTNQSTQFTLFPSSFFSGAGAPTLSLQARHPLLDGAGTEYTGIAAPRLGPFGRSTAIVGVNQGVVIARINADITLTDFEAAVRNLVKDVEDLYWDLQLAYHIYHSQKVALSSAGQTWLSIDGDPARRTAAERAQSKDNYFEIKANTENARADIYAKETRLRRLIGLPVNDGRVIRPADEPLTARFDPDWKSCLIEALTRRVELRRQKWAIKSLALQLSAASSLTRGQLDLVAGANVNGFGDDLFSNKKDRFSSAYGVLASGNFTSLEFGLQYSVTWGLRTARSQVRNLELRLSKARAALVEQEIEISHELAAAFQALDRGHATAQINFNRRIAAAERVRASQAKFEDGGGTLDLLLRAQVSLAQAEIAYFQSLINYNKAIAEIEFRKGTSLRHNGVRLAEGPWSDGEAYRQALRRAEARSHGIRTELMQPEPPPLVEPYEQPPPAIDPPPAPEE